MAITSKFLKRQAMMTNPFLRYALSPLSVLLFIILTEVLYRYGYNVSLGLPLMALSLCLFWSGLKANIVSAILITAYGLSNPIWDTSRLIILILTVWPVAIGGGLMKIRLIETVQEEEYQRLRAEDNQDKADAYDTLNGNIQTLRKLARRLTDLCNAWNVLNDKAKLDIVEEAQGTIVNLAQKVVGWHEIAKEKQELLKDDD
jgi:hypothetical protein